LKEVPTFFEKKQGQGFDLFEMCEAKGLPFDDNKSVCGAQEGPYFACFCRNQFYVIPLRGPASSEFMLESFPFRGIFAGIIQSQLGHMSFQSLPCKEIHDLKE